MKGVSSPSASSTLVLTDRCSVGFWTGGPNTFPAREGQLGTPSPLGPEPPANLGRGPMWMQRGLGVGGPPPGPPPPPASQGLSRQMHPRTTTGAPEKPDARQHPGPRASVGCVYTLRVTSLCRRKGHQEAVRAGPEQTRGAPPPCTGPWAPGSGLSPNSSRVWGFPHPVVLC